MAARAKMRSSYRFFVPETVQTSAMDCGPASLKCLLEGFGIPVSYGRLREACQTDVDGTSIDTLETMAAQLGLVSEQIMLPPDHLLLPEAKALPAIIVVRLPNNLTHFIVIWRRHGNLIQVMDPSIGRSWLTMQQLLDRLYLHTIAVPAEGWREWAATDDFLKVLRRRLTDLGLSDKLATDMISEALADPHWRPIATLDAATRMVAAIALAGGLKRGRQTANALKSFYQQSQLESFGNDQSIPYPYWSVRPQIQNLEVENQRPADEEEQLLLRGAVLVRITGRRLSAIASPTIAIDSATDKEAADLENITPLSPELIAALAEKPSRPGRELLRLLRADGLLTPMTLFIGMALAAGGLLIEALLLRGFCEIGNSLALSEQRLGAFGALLLFTGALLLLELPLMNGLLRLGRHLEIRLRIAFLEKIPLLGDRYFQSRLTSDMAQRSHSVHQLRQLPVLGGRLIRTSLELTFTTIGIIWLDPLIAPLALISALLAMILPLATQPLMLERDLRARSHEGALSRFYLDALLGIVTIRAHGAERAVRREHENLLIEWIAAGLSLQRIATVVQGILSILSIGMVVWLLFDHLLRTGGAGSLLLLVYWTLNLPVLGQELAQLAQQYPLIRNITLRLLEPLGAPSEAAANQVAVEVIEQAVETAPTETARLVQAVVSQSSTNTVQRSPILSPLSSLPAGGLNGEINLVGPAINKTARGVRIELQKVSVVAAGHKILSEIDLTIPAGSHIAIVGRSGAGKSSLAGLLLGWHRPASGDLIIDGEPINRQSENRQLAALRQSTAWVDPSIQLWNRSLLENLQYGVAGDCGAEIGRVVAAAELRTLLERLPAGFQTSLGEGGALVSGGEGQRVRLARAMLRPDVRLTILDEPFRGLDRERRRKLLSQSRELWRDNTLICITHDIAETSQFDRVIVIEDGAIVEDGAPAELRNHPDSRYRALLEAETEVRAGLWSDEQWRRLWLEDGRIFENDGHIFEDDRKGGLHD